MIRIQLQQHAIKAKIQHHLRHRKYCTDQKPGRIYCHSRAVR